VPTALASVQLVRPVEQLLGLGSRRRPGHSRPRPGHGSSCTLIHYSPTLSLFLSSSRSGPLRHTRVGTRVQRATGGPGHPPHQSSNGTTPILCRGSAGKPYTRRMPILLLIRPPPHPSLTLTYFPSLSLMQVQNPPPMAACSPSGCRLLWGWPGAPNPTASPPGPPPRAPTTAAHAHTPVSLRGGDQRARLGFQNGIMPSQVGASHVGELRRRGRPAHPCT
jgi:hypothetical protein